MIDLALPFTVTLNLFQGPSCLTARMVRVEEWVLKQVQHDGLGARFS
jgi:hypothetical protein